MDLLQLSRTLEMDLTGITQTMRQRGLLSHTVLVGERYMRFESKQAPKGARCKWFYRAIDLEDEDAVEIGASRENFRFGLQLRGHNLMLMPSKGTTKAQLRTDWEAFSQRMSSALHGVDFTNHLFGDVRSMVARKNWRGAFGAVALVEDASERERLTYYIETYMRREHDAMVEMMPSLKQASTSEEE